MSLTCKKKKAINEQKYLEQTVARIICNLTLSLCQWHIAKLPINSFALLSCLYCITLTLRLHIDWMKYIILFSLFNNKKYFHGTQMSESIIAISQIESWLKQLLYMEIRCKENLIYPKRSIYHFCIESIDKFYLDENIDIYVKCTIIRIIN